MRWESNTLTTQRLRLPAAISLDSTKTRLTFKTNPNYSKLGAKAKS